MDRHWFLTWTTYGTWLPGDDRGFVSNVRAGNGPEVKHAEPGTPYDQKQRGLTIAAQEQLRGDPVWLRSEHAVALVEQFQETARFRGWAIIAVAIMANHIHIVLGVSGDPEPDSLLRDLKSYGSRRLNRLAGKPTSGNWWTAGGSRRILRGETALRTVVKYVQNQSNPLIIWTGEPAA